MEGGGVDVNVSDTRCLTPVHQVRDFSSRNFFRSGGVGWCRVCVCVCWVGGGGVLTKGFQHLFASEVSV